MISYDSICCFRGAPGDGRPRILWELTTRCNLRCSFCHTRPSQSKELPMPEVVKGLNVLKGWGIKDVIFSGGEPLLRSDILDILYHARHMGFEVDLCTNGTLLSRPIARSLSPVLSEISISLDSACAHIHDSLRGCTGTWEKTLRGTDHALSAGMEVHIISLVCDLTVHGIEDTLALLLDLGVHSVTLLGLIDFPGTSSGLTFSRDARNSILKRLTSLRHTFSGLIINTKGVVDSNTDETCPAGSAIGGITAGGVILPCILLKNSHQKRGMRSCVGKASWKELFEEWSPGAGIPCKLCAHPQHLI